MHFQPPIGSPSWSALRKHIHNARGFGSHLVDAGNAGLSDGTGDEYHFSGRPYRRDHGTPVARSQREPGPIFAPCAAAALYNCNAWNRAGGMDEDFFCYSEDVDLAFRMRLHGLHFRFAPAAICQHLGSAITGVRSDFSVYHGQRNLVWTFVKNMPTPLFWFLLPAHIGLNLFAVGRFAMRGQLRVVLRAKWDALCGLESMWRKRKLIQKQRLVSARSVWSVLNKQIFH